MILKYDKEHEAYNIYISSYIHEKHIKYILAWYTKQCEIGGYFISKPPMASEMHLMRFGFAAGSQCEQSIFPLPADRWVGGCSILIGWPETSLGLSLWCGSPTFQKVQLFVSPSQGQCGGRWMRNQKCLLNFGLGACKSWGSVIPTKKTKSTVLPAQPISGTNRFGQPVYLENKSSHLVSGE